MGFSRRYKLKCDKCENVHDERDAMGRADGYASARAARAAAIRDGWGRREVVTGRHQRYIFKEDEQGNLRNTWALEWVDDKRYRDYCPACCITIDREQAAQNRQGDN